MSSVRSARDASVDVGRRARARARLFLPRAVPPNDDVSKTRARPQIFLLRRSRLARTAAMTLATWREREPAVASSPAPKHTRGARTRSRASPTSATIVISRGRMSAFARVAVPGAPPSPSPSSGATRAPMVPTRRRLRRDRLRPRRAPARSARRHRRHPRLLLLRRPRRQGPLRAPRRLHHRHPQGDKIRLQESRAQVPPGRQQSPRRRRAIQRGQIRVPDPLRPGRASTLRPPPRRRRRAPDRPILLLGFGARPNPDPTTGRGSRVREVQEEPFYGFSDFWRDVEKEFEAFEKSRPDPGKPRTLWEELGTLGEEFVDFLEESAFDAASTTTDPFTGETTTKRTRYSSSSSEETNGNGGRGRPRTRRRRRAGAPRRGTDRGGRGRAPPKRGSVDEMLEKMKRDMGLK